MSKKASPDLIPGDLGPFKEGRTFTILVCRRDGVRLPQTFLQFSWTSQNFPKLPEKLPGNFPETSLGVDAKSNPEVPGSFVFARLAEALP